MIAPFLLDFLVRSIRTFPASIGTNGAGLLLQAFWIFAAEIVVTFLVLFVRGEKHLEYLAKWRVGLLIYLLTLIVGYGPFFIRNMTNVAGQIETEANAQAPPAIALPFPKAAPIHSPAVKPIVYGSMHATFVFLDSSKLLVDGTSYNGKFPANLAGATVSCGIPPASPVTFSLKNVTRGSPIGQLIVSPKCELTRSTPQGRSQPFSMNDRFSLGPNNDDNKASYINLMIPTVHNQ